jgi:uncharacterized protein (DUF433 family)
MNCGGNNLIGVGIYSVPEAHRLTGVSTWCIRRWLAGYSYVYNGARRASPPVWTPDIPAVDGHRAISFLDLIEVRFVDAFLKQGISWKLIRKAEEKGREAFNTTHPFATNRFRSDGRTVLATVDHQGCSRLLDIIKSQRVFDSIVQPFIQRIDFADDGRPMVWWPLATSKRVVIDPLRCFGQPIVSSEGVPTHILFAARKSGQTLGEISQWYEVEKPSVQAAIRFEKQLLVA